jgi:hypothetical protein
VRGLLLKFKTVRTDWRSLIYICVALATSGIYLYKLNAFLDVSPNSVDQMVYRNYPLKDCAVTSLGIWDHQMAV